MQVNINKPSTVRISFKTTPNCFKLYDAKGNMYYFRYLNGINGPYPRIKFNIPDIGIYNSPDNFEINSIKDIEIPKNLPRLPPAERDRLQPEVIKFNPNLTGTPARIFTDTNPAIIEVSKEFYMLPNPIQLFLLLHEKGHQFYATEKYCDLYALVNFIRMGYNQSMGYYTLIKILGRSKQSIERIKSMFQTINNIMGEFNPGI